ncbi:MAG: threonine synthase [Bdellovibrionia bacterium]
MMFRSTRRSGAAVGLSVAIEKGLAADGGLFVPVTFPRADISKLDPGNLAVFGAGLLAPFFKGEPLESKIPALCAEAFSFEAPLKQIDDGLHVLELFHGPTAAFKDFGAGFLARFFAASKKEAIILVATSGDTGGAVAAAFDGMPGIDVFVLFPDKGVSRRQRHQLTCWGPNIHSFAVTGTFDDCQSLVKQAFATWKGKRRLSSANSINIGRLLPQVVYYGASSLQYRAETGRPASYIIPTGNLGNAQAAVWARELGFPIQNITFACNANEILKNYFETGRWEPKQTVATLANAMDVGNPSNMERLLDVYQSPREARHQLEAFSATDDQIRDAIENAYRRWNWVVCPHTAVAVHDVLRRERPDVTVVATAHPAKFETIVEPIIGRAIPLPPALKAIEGRKEMCKPLPVSLDGLLEELRKAD